MRLLIADSVGMLTLSELAPDTWRNGGYLAAKMNTTYRHHAAPSSLTSPQSGSAVMSSVQ